jgi:hypothetical protein
MMTQRTWLAIAALVLGGCADLCPGDQTSSDTFAAMASYGKQITACIRGEGCDRLCSDAFHLDEIESCVITSVVPQDASAQPVPVAPSIDPQSLLGVNVRVTYVEQVTCDPGLDIAADDGSTDDGSTDDGSTDDGSDDGSCDDVSCDGSGDDGSGDDGSGDGSGDDGSGDDGSGDGSGDDGSGGDGSGGDVAPAPTPGSTVGRAPVAASTGRHGHRGVGHR